MNLVAATALWVIAAACLVTAQTRRTPWGDPDLQGVYMNGDEFIVPLERPAQFAGKRTQDVSAAEFAEFIAQRNDERARTAERNNAFRGLTAQRFDLKPSRPWLVSNPADGQVPRVSPEGQKRQRAFAARNAQPPNSAADFNLVYRCISSGVPGVMLPTSFDIPYQFVQGPGVVAIVYEALHETRIVPLDPRPELGDAIRMYTGDARAHWEGDTLVVETSHMKGDYRFTSAASRDLRVVERFTPDASGNLEWSVTFHDSSTWEHPWTIAMTLTRTRDDQAPLEAACHEGNYFMFNALRGAR